MEHMSKDVMMQTVGINAHVYSGLVTTGKLSSSSTLAKPKTSLFEFRNVDELKLVTQESTKLSHWVTV